MSSGSFVAQLFYGIDTGTFQAVIGTCTKVQARRCSSPELSLSLSSFSIISLTVFAFSDRSMKSFRCSLKTLAARLTRLVRIQCSSGVKHPVSVVVIGNLPTRVFTLRVYTLNRCIDSIHSENADRHVIALAFVSTDITDGFLDRQLHSTACCPGRRSGLRLPDRIHDLNILIYLNIGCSYNSLALELNISNFLLRWLRAVIADCKALQVHDDFCNVFFFTPGWS